MLSIGIVGLPNVGKSSLFNVLTKSQVLASNYPFATIEPNVGIVAVPDERLDKLAKIYQTNKIIPATIQFTDIAGLVSGASQGEGLGNKFLSHIRNTAAILEVVRLFNDAVVTHVNDKIDPIDDIGVITTELVLADLSTVNKRLLSLEKEVKANPKLNPKLTIIKEVQTILNSNLPVRNNINDEDIEEIKDLNLLTTKPIIYLFNIDETDINNKELQDKYRKLVEPNVCCFISVKLESELADLSENDANELRLSYGLTRSGLDEVILAAYKALGLQSFLTAGQKEVRAWTIPRGSTAPQAAGVIHTDFERGFISAEIVDYNDLISLGSVAACRNLGKIRVEGKNYVMQPNDVVEFRFNV